MTNKISVLSHSSELHLLTAMPLLRTHGLGVLRLGGVMAELPQRAEWERELNRSYYACGCDSGAAARAEDRRGDIVRVRGLQAPNTLLM